MKNFLKRKATYTILISIFLITNQYCSINMEEEQKLLHQETTKQEENVSLKKNDDLFKKIESEMKLLNMLFEKKPAIVLRTESAYDIAKKTLELLDNLEIKNKTTEFDEKKTEEELAFILKCKDNLLKPINKFFESIHKYSSLLKPLVEKILIQNNLKCDKENPSFILNFFDVDANKASSFFEEVLIDKDSIIKACKEFLILFSTVNNNISEKAKHQAYELYQKFISTKNKRNNPSQS